MKILYLGLLLLTHIYVFADINSTVWRVGVSETNNSGTGFFLSSNTFVTNFHVVAELAQHVKNVRNILLTQQDSGQMIRVKRIISISALYDLAVLQTEQSVDSYLETAKESFSLSQPLRVVGYPGGQLKIFQQMGNINVAGDGSISFPINSSSVKGISGAPMINAQDKVIGVLSSAAFNIIYLPIPIDRVFVTIHHRGGRTFVNRCSGCSLPEWVKKAMQQLVRLAKNSNKKAQYHLGLFYFDGIGVRKNMLQSKKWLKKASAQGHLYAQEKLSNILLFDNIHSEEGIRLLRSASAGGLALAHQLLSFYLNELQEKSFAGEKWAALSHELKQKVQNQNLHFIPDFEMLKVRSFNLCMRSFFR